MARDHFIDMGEQVHKHIYDLNLAWGQFLDFYSDLNNARKAQDDGFVERQYIGEELVEPDEQPITNNDLIEPDEEDEDQQRRNFYAAFEDGYDDVARSSDAPTSVKKA